MLDYLMETIGDVQTAALLGLSVGLLFGAAAQHSRFCLRAATAEVADGHAGPRLSVWLMVFASALLATQFAAYTGFLDYGEARQIASVGSLSGAIVGGALFGTGMVLARGCASRLLVLSATGNMRALVTGLILTLVAQASLRGVLAPAREAIFGLWTIEGGPARDLMLRLGLSREAVLGIGVLILGAGVTLAVTTRLEISRAVAAILIGISIALGWAGTYMIARNAFDPVAISSVTFTGPATDTLMALINESSIIPSFSIGLVPGVFAGSAIMSAASGEFRIQRFDATSGMERYLLGACMMGFGSMLAGGCAVGAGVSGGAVLSLTAWVAVFFMWLSALLANLIQQNATRQIQRT